jgi:extradiol dioxygenase family protein
MRDQLDTFHLAVPVSDLEAAEDFYVRLLGCKLARRYPDRITLDFFGDQLVCHLSQLVPADLHPTSLYPRHFGVTFRRREDFDALLALCELRKLPFFAPVGTRFEGLAEVHRTFVLCDPSGNLLEFKHYRDPRIMY